MVVGAWALWGAAQTEAQHSGAESTLVTRQTGSFGKMPPDYIPHFYNRAESVTEYQERRFVVTPDGNRVAYRSLSGGGACVVIDGVAGRAYREIGKGTPLFSPDSKRVAYFAQHQDDFKWAAVVDGAESKAYDNIKEMAFSPNSKHLAFVAQAEHAHFVVVDGMEQKRHSDTTVTGVSNITFSPDGQRLAYKVWTRGENPHEFVVVDGQEGPTWNGIDFICFSPDSRHVAYLAKLWDGNAWVKLVVLDGHEGGRYDEIGDFFFSPDSKRVAYGARAYGRNGGKPIAVVDGVENVSALLAFPPFSPDSQHFAYMVSKEFVDTGGCSIVLDGAAGKGYTKITDFFFSPDSRWVACEVMDFSQGVRAYVCVNGAICRERFDYFVPYSGIVFDGPNKFHFLAAVNDDILRFETTIGPGNAPAK
jgi:WD40 repeat protein